MILINDVITLLRKIIHILDELHCDGTITKVTTASLFAAVS